MNIDDYFKYIQEEVKKTYAVAEKARAVGIDPVSKVETPVAMTLAEKAVGLISTVYPQLNTPELVNRILDLEKEFGQLDPTVCFRIAEDIAREKYCKFENLLQAIDAGIRVAFSYFTLGVVSSPIEGFTGLSLGKTKDGKEYFIANFSGPIRSAGTTAGCVVLMIIDYLREIFGYAKYDPDENEVKRYVTENYDYHERVTNLQYLPTEEEITYLAKNLPFQISGEPTEQREVSNYKDLPRVPTDFIRGGMCLIFSEGLAQKAQKGFRLYNQAKSNGVKATGWDFLDEFIKKFKEKKKGGKKDSTPVYIKDLVAGRPVYGHPGKSGGFRFRYGRSRTSGFSATSIHPATMVLSDNFLSFGNQLKIEKPTKGCAISSCDSIDGPIVKFKDGSVKKINTYDEAVGRYDEVEEIIYLGDLLVSFGDVINRNYDLIKPGYVEEWWKLELDKVLFEKKKKVNFDEWNVKIDEALEFSKKYGVPLYPRYIFYWKEIDKEKFFGLIDWLSRGQIREGKFVLPYSIKDKERFRNGKRALELIGCEHEVTLENIVLNKISTRALFANLGISIDNKFDKEFDNLMKKISETEFEDVLDVVNKLSEFKIKDKSGTFIGARMGRPEKAKLRKLTGSPHALFTVGNEGGRLRSFQAAYDVGSIYGEFATFHCDKCKKDDIYPKCVDCGAKCTRLKYSPFEDRYYRPEEAMNEDKLLDYKRKRIDIRKYFDNAKKITKVTGDEIPIVKGIRGTSNADHSCEHLGKGFLRSKYGLNVNKDGTIRYDMTEMAITHFKPKEIGTSVEKLKELGYEKDIHGKELVNDNQVLEMFPHDVILPACETGDNERANDVFLKITQFVDEELEKLYGLPKYFNSEKVEDVLGQLVVCIAPHICTASVGRIIGFSKTQTLLASPFMHAAMRRDCFDYDSYIPIKSGGTWKIKKIGDIVEEMNPVNVVDKFGTREKKVEDVSCIGLGKNNNSEVKVNNFTKHTKRDMYRIKTASGREISVTDNHKFLIEDKIKRCVDLRVGDLLPVKKKINIKSVDVEEINLLDELANANMMIRGIRSIIERIDKNVLNELRMSFGISKKQFLNYKLRDSYPIQFINELPEDIRLRISKKGKIAAKRDNVELPIRISVDEEFLEIVGLYIAEGYSRTVSGKKGLNQVYISSLDKSILNYVKKIMKKKFGLDVSERKNDRATYSSKVLYLLFNEILDCGVSSRVKRIPSRFLSLPLNKLGALLRGYFEGDGSVERNRKKIACDSVSEGLLYDLEFCLSRFGIFTKRYKYCKQGGPVLREFYSKKGECPEFEITKLVIGSDFVKNFSKIGFISKRKSKIFKNYKNKSHYGMRIKHDSDFVYDPIISIDYLGEKQSYCLNVDEKNHLVSVNSIFSRQCDGDEAAAILLMDVLINFSKKFLPAHRGGTQDSPLVLNTYIRAGDVDDQILDLETTKYPLELYEKAEKGIHSSEVEGIEIIKNRLKEGKNPFENVAFTHDCDDFNKGVMNSSYKSIPSMQEKVEKQMRLCGKLRSVDISDVARLVIERHFIRDTRGNLRKFSMQKFRCVKCNESYRRPPLGGKCIKCGGRIIFTISEGSVLKYMQPALDLARNFNVSPYLLESLELTEMYIHSIFGKEKEKQEDLKKWF